MEGARGKEPVRRMGRDTKKQGNDMRVLKLAAAAATLMIGTVLAQADQTNLVENMHIRLYGLSQGGTTTNRSQVVTSVRVTVLDSRRVIQALGTATGNDFSRHSRLVLITPLNGEPSSVEVRDGDVKVDVTGFFVLEQTGPGVHSSVLNTRTGRSSRNLYSIQRFVLQDSPDFPALGTHFDVSGLAVDSSTNFPRPGPDNKLNISAAGNGDLNGVPLVIQGSVNISGQTLEVVPDEDNNLLL